MKTSMYLQTTTKSKIVTLKEEEIRLRRSMAAAQSLLQKGDCISIGKLKFLKKDLIFSLSIS